MCWTLALLESPSPHPPLGTGAPLRLWRSPSRPGGAFPQSQPGASLGEAGSPPSLPRSSVALCKLLQHGITADDRRLQDIRVKGEELHSPDEGVRTRSKSAKSAWPRPHPRWARTPGGHSGGSSVLGPSGATGRLWSSCGSEWTACLAASPLGARDPRAHGCRLTAGSHSPRHPRGSVSGACGALICAGPCVLAFSQTAHPL